MKDFMKDYWDYQKSGFAFMKKHPVGTIGIMVVGGVIGMAPVAVEKIKEVIEERKVRERINKIEMEGSESEEA